MKKARISALAFVFVCLFGFIFPPAALAHPGRTDSSGGHTDHSTGEYHYHHGFPAHQHYDIDGDGVVDCPFEFEDNTSSAANTVRPTQSPRPAEKPVQAAMAKSESSKSGFSGSLLVPIGFGTFMLLYFLSACFSWVEQREAYRKQYEGVDIMTLSGAPEGTYFENGCLKGTGADYTYYISRSGTKYHCVKGCSGAYIAVNAAEACKKKLTPCKRCKPRQDPVSWCSSYNRISEVKRKYKIK